MKKIFLPLALIGILSLVLSFFAISAFADEKLSPPEKISPTQNQKNVPSTVSFEWKSVTGADKYEIVVWLADSNQEVAQKAFTKTEKTFKLEEGIAYWWDVRACHATGLFGWWNDCEKQEFGGRWEFTTKGTAPLEIVTTKLNNGTVGLKYEEKIVIKGGVSPHSWSVKEGELPPGLSLNPETGTIKGKPTEWKASPGWKFKVRVMDDSSPNPQIAESKELKIFVSVTKLEITTSERLSPGAVGENYNVALEAKGGIPPYEWESAPLTGDIYPKGLNINSDGTISGVPLKGGNFRFGVMVDDSFPETLGALKQFFVKIESIPLKIITTSLSAGDLDKEYFVRLEAHGGTPPYSWSKTAGTFPNGLNLSNGIISGTPTKEGTFTFTVLLTDDEETDKAQVLAIKINPPPKCGNKVCESEECTTCPGDCTIADCCGNGTCDSAVGESTSNCPEDCGAPSKLCGNGTCDPGECRSECTTDCAVADCCGIEGCNTVIGETAENCPKDCAALPPTEAPPGDGAIKIVKGKLELAWPNSPMGTSLTDNSKLVDFIKYLYEWGIALGGLAAFIALVIAGFQYLTSAGNAIKMRDAMKRIQSAVLGLLLLLGSVLILNTINPQLTTLKMPPGLSETELKPIEIEEKKGPSVECQKVKIYSTAGGSASIDPDTGCKSLGAPISSITIYGSCEVELYSQKRDCDNQFLVGAVRYVAEGNMPESKEFTNIKNLIKYSDEEAYSVKVKPITY
ncbi:hypothetical protein ES703_47763 [subsurface metagenome]